MFKLTYFFFNSPVPFTTAFEFRLVIRGEEWKQVEQHYKIGKELGTCRHSGAFAVVRMATHKETNKEYAMKIVDKQKMKLVQTKRK